MAVRSRSAAVASDPIAQAAADKHLADGGSAIGAVLAGFFAAAGAYPGVLLGPVTILVAGIGAGGRAFDGRLRQPGLSGKRPRGFQKHEDIPDTARVAVPTAVAAIAVAHGYEPGGTLARVVRPGVEQAEHAGAKARAALLDRIRSVGAAALHEPAFTRPLLKLASPVTGGQITPGDFAHAGEIDHPVIERGMADAVLLEAPWAEAATAESADALGEGAAVCAVDVHGLFAALAHRRVSAGLYVEELELVCPLAAVPTLRGVPRVAPGTRLPAPAPIGVVCDAKRGPIEVVAEPSRIRLEPEPHAGRISVRRDPGTRLVEVARV